MQIEYYTENGWNHYTTRDDPLFTSLLEPYEDLGVPPPSRVKLSGAVASIIEEQWSIYQKLKKYMEYIEGVSKEISRKNKNKKKWMNKYTSDDMMTVMVTLTEPSFVPHQPIYFDEIESLSRILNLPRGWEVFVTARDVTPEEMRLHHLIAQGRVMAEISKEIGVNNAKEYMSVFPPGDLGPKAFTQFILREVTYEEINRLKKNEEKAILMSDILFGVIRTSMLNAYSAGRRLMWYDVPWDDLNTLLTRHASSKLLTKDRAMVKILAGRGGHKERQLTRDVEVKGNDPKLYDRLLLSYDEEDDRRLIDSIAILPYSAIDRYNIADYVEQENTNAMLRYLDVKQLDEQHVFSLGINHEDTLNLFRLMYRTTVGRNGVIRILLAALRLMEKGETKDTTAIARAAETILDELENEVYSERLSVGELSDELILSLSGRE